MPEGYRMRTPIDIKDHHIRSPPERRILSPSKEGVSLDALADDSSSRIKIPFVAALSCYCTCM